MRPLAALLLIAALVAGCGDQTTISKGGRVPGDILTVYLMLPREGERAEAAEAMIRGAKLALSEAGGRVGEYTVQFASAKLPDGGPEEPIADVVRDVVRDTGTIGVIGDLDRRTLRVTAPLLNAAGVLHVSPGTGASGFPQPSASRTFFPLVPDDQTQAAALLHIPEGDRVAVETEPGYELAGDVPTKRADTVIYAGSDPVNARGAVEGILDENRRADVLLSQELATTTLARELGPRVRAITSAREGVPPGFETAFPGVDPGPFARAGYDAMKDILAAVRRAGGDAQSRQAVIDAFRATPAGPYRLID